MGYQKLPAEVVARWSDEEKAQYAKDQADAIQQVLVEHAKANGTFKLPAEQLTTYDKIRRDVLKVAKWVAIVGLGVWIIVILANQYYG